MPVVARLAIDRFMDKVLCEPNTGHWFWIGSRQQRGYGKFWNGERAAPMQAHRFAYEAFVGPIAPGLTIDHTCRVPACVNPAHLRAVTMRENVLAGRGPSAQHAAATHCHRGHPFDAENTWIEHGRTGVARHCRTCSRARKQAARGAAG